MVGFGFHNMPCMIKRGTFVMLLLSCGAVRPTNAAGLSDKKLIELGWDQPTDVTTRKDIATMEKAPFDGVVLGALGWEGDRRIDLYKVAWGSEAFTRTQFQRSVDDLKATAFHRFTDNFVRLDVTPGDVDWFDDAGWKSIVNNAEIASWICNEGRLKGVFFDTEQYGSQVFYYQKQKEKDAHTYEAYRAKARERGREYGKALTSEKHDAVIIMSYATSYLGIAKQPPLDWSILGLLPAFIDGMLEGADQRAAFVDGLETAYDLKNSSDFATLKRQARDADVLSLDPRRYRERMKYGFGFWLDDKSDKPEYKWDPANTSTNFYQPAELQKALNGALEHSDGYVWVYTQKINWWTGEGLSTPYLTAMENAKTTQ